MPAEFSPDALANTWVAPGLWAVSSPVLSTVATLESSVPQVNWPIWLVMSLAPLKA